VDHALVDDFLVTIKIRVTVTDPEGLVEAWQDRDPATADRLSGEPELTLALQDAVKPPDLSAVAGLVPHRADGMFALVKAEPWTEGADPW